jgi:hypothetical protein
VYLLLRVEDTPLVEEPFFEVINEVHKYINTFGFDSQEGHFISEVSVVASPFLFT